MHMFFKHSGIACTVKPHITVTYGTQATGCCTEVIFLWDKCVLTKSKYKQQSYHIAIKFGWDSNLAVWPQTERKKYWWNLNLAVAPCSVLRHHKHCERVEECVYQGALPSSHLRYLNKAVGLQIYKKYNWQRVSDELAICTACEKGCQAGPSVLQHVVAGMAKIILVDFT